MSEATRDRFDINRLRRDADPARDSLHCESKIAAIATLITREGETASAHSERKKARRHLFRGEGKKGDGSPLSRKVRSFFGRSRRVFRPRT